MPLRTMVELQTAAQIFDPGFALNRRDRGREIHVRHRRIKHAKWPARIAETGSILRHSLRWPILREGT